MQSASLGWSGSAPWRLRLFFRSSDAAVLGLYDQRGMLRYAGPGRAECLAYAELFELGEEGFSLEPLFAVTLPGQLAANGSTQDLAFG